MTLSRHIAYLEAQGITPLMLRVPLDGALPSSLWSSYSSDDSDAAVTARDSVVVADAVTGGDLSAQLQADASTAIQSAVAEFASVKTADLREDLLQSKTQPVAPAVVAESTPAPVVNFNIGVYVADSLLIIDALPPVAQRRSQQQLLANIAQAMLARSLQGQFLDINWPLKDHRQLDHSDKAALSFIETWLEALAARQQTRFVLLCGELAQQWFLPAINTLNLPWQHTASAVEMLDKPALKAESWRQIRPFQSLVAARHAP